MTDSEDAKSLNLLVQQSREQSAVANPESQAFNSSIPDAPIEVNNGDINDLRSTQAIKEPPIPELTPQEIEAKKQWKASHGYFNIPSEYMALSESELEPLAQQGDISALYTLAKKKGITDPKAAVDYDEQAAVHGSTFALAQIVNLYRFHMAREGDLLGQSERQVAVDSVAYGLVAQRLGDDQLGSVITGDALTLCDEMDDRTQKDVCERADDIASREQQRIQRGLNYLDETSAPHGISAPVRVTPETICES